MRYAAHGEYMLITKYYPKEHYATVFNPNTGFFARIEDAGYEEPFWSEHGPELLDISITSWCDRACQVCYRNAGVNGKHMECGDYEHLLRQAASAGVMQVALGGGNPNQHPEFIHILEVTRKKYGIVPWYAVRTLLSAGVTTNIHFVLDDHSIDTAILWLQDPPPILKTINAVVFLNYKPVGRRAAQPSILRNSHRLQDFFSLIEHAEHPFRIGFDSCMVSGVASYTSIDPSLYDACEAGRFSMFISESMMMYPCSFMDGKDKGEPADQVPLVTAWRNSDLFREFRESLLGHRCNDCCQSHICMGGCPIFEDVNICRSRTKHS